MRNLVHENQNIIIDRDLRHQRRMCDIFNFGQSEFKAGLGSFRLRNSQAYSKSAADERASTPEVCQKVRTVYAKIGAV